MGCYDFDATSPDSIRLRFRHNSDVADMLCSIIGTIGIDKIISLLDTEFPEIKGTAYKGSEIKKWWEEHLKMDNLRTKEKIEEEFLKKLYELFSDFNKNLNEKQKEMFSGFRLDLKINKSESLGNLYLSYIKNDGEQEYEGEQ